MKKYEGIIVPMITPLKSDHRIDEAAVEKLFSVFQQHEISPFILGTTGESASLSVDTKRELIGIAGKYKQPGMTLYSGISSNVITESLALAAFGRDQGVDAVAATLPHYYQLTGEEMKVYFQTLADQISVPLIIYNIPAATHTSIPLNLIDELSYHENIIATKDSERSDDRLQQSLALWKARTDFNHFQGWASRSAIALLGGSKGLVPSTGNLFPEIYQKMWKAAQQNNQALALEMQELSDRYGKMYQSGRTLGQSLCALKILMAQKGICNEIMMPPIQAIDDSDRKKLLKEYELLTA